MESINLKKFLEKYKVEIPMLQRDYAQGRKSQENVANAFLDSIFDVLNDNNKSLHMDFIYGYKEKDKFILIDGQQRVTTLWLLHFYLYKKADRLEEIEASLERFSYNTRESSAEFCTNLLSESFELSKKPSEAIIEMGGVFEDSENLRNDPTIKAMLNMLDLIFARIKGIKDKKSFFKLSTNLDCITFDLFDMDEFSLGEELYIKMNARGKQLSRYENLKSFIEKGLASEDKELLASIDTNWSDYFFNPNDIDKFDIRGSIFLHYANLFFILLESDEKIDQEVIKSSEHAIDDFYHPLQKLENIKLLDLVIELRDSFRDYKINQSSFFDKDLGYKSICYFFAILHLARIVQEGKGEFAKANDYLRVCKHFIENHVLDNWSHIKSFFNFFKHISEDFENIYQFLIENPKHSFNAKIYGLEVRKAGLILESRNGGRAWEEILNKTSDHPMLLGWVDFLLDFSDEEFKYENYNKVELIYKNPNLDKFKQYADLTMNIFDKKFLTENLTLFKRAFLCIGNYGTYARNWFYGNVPSIYRDREVMNNLLSGIENYKKIPYFKAFLDELIEHGTNEHDLSKKMQKIIDNTDLSAKEWWEQLLIKQKEMFGFIDEAPEVFQRYRRIRFFFDGSPQRATKVELLPGVRSVKNVRCLLDFAFYYYCKQRLEGVSEEYTCEEEQLGHKYPLESHFSINGKDVFCDSKEFKITIGDDEFLLESENIFYEFDEIIHKIKRLTIDI